MEDENSNQAPDCSDVEVTKVVGKIKKKAKKCNTAMKKIVADVAGNVSLPVAAKLPDTSYLAGAGRRTRSFLIILNIPREN